MAKTCKIIARHLQQFTFDGVQKTLTVCKGSRLLKMPTHFVRDVMCVWKISVLVTLKFHLRKKYMFSVPCFLIFKNILILLHLFLFSEFFIRVSFVKEFSTVIFERIFKYNMRKLITTCLYFMYGN